MAKKPVFMLALRNSDPVPTPYTPLMYTRGTQTHRLALVKRHDSWQVCDIGSGALVLRVTKKSVLCPFQWALADLDTLVDRIGLEKFESVLSNPKPF